MRGHVGELLELGVGAAELDRLLRQRELGQAALGDLAPELDVGQLDLALLGVEPARQGRVWPSSGQTLRAPISLDHRRMLPEDFRPESTSDA